MAMRRFLQLNILSSSLSQSLNPASSIVPRCSVLSPVSFMSTSTDPDFRFQNAKMTLNKLQNDPGNEVKLKMYSLFKQATEGKNETKKPSAFNFVAQVKWTAWNDLGDMTKDEAKAAYADIVDGLAEAEGYHE